MSRSSGTSKRQRPLTVIARVTPDEKRAITEKARDYGGVSALFRVAVLNARPRPSQVDREAYAQALGAVGQLASEVNKIGSNLNQLTHYANLGRTLESNIQATLDELNATVIRDLMDVRTRLMKALGMERDRH